MKVLLMLVALSIAPFAQAEKTDLELVSQQGVAYFFTLSKPWIRDQAYVERTARAFCSDKQVCRFHVWEKGSTTPRGYPMTDKEIAAEVASFEQNKSTKLSRMNWSCKVFRHLPKGQCFS